DGSALTIGQQAVDDDRQALLAVAAVAVTGQGTGAAFVVAAADVVEDHRPLRQVASGQLLLDVALAAEQPVHRGVQFLAAGIADAELLGQGGGVPIAGRGELGTRGQDALHNQGQDQGALPGGLGGEEVFQIELAAGREDRFDMAVGAALGSAERLGGGDEGFASEGPLDEADESGRQMRKVAKGTVLDLALVAVGLAQQVGDVSLAGMLADDLGHMHGGARNSQSGVIDTVAGEPSRPSKYSWLQTEAENGRKRLARSD